MTVLFSLTVDKQEVENGETVTYTAHVQNDLVVEAPVKVAFFERMPNGELRLLNTQTKMIGPLENDYFYLYLVADQVAGYNYNICAKSGIASSDFYDDLACAPTVHIREESLGVLVEGCTVDETAVDVGGSVRYTARVRNATGIQQTIYIDFYDIVAQSVLGMYNKMMLPDEVATFTHTEVCNVPLRRYRVCARWVSAGGAPMGASACAPDVQVSGVVEEEPGGGFDDGTGGVGDLIGGDIPVAAIAFIGAFAIGGGLLYLFGNRGE